MLLLIAALALLPGCGDSEPQAEPLDSELARVMTQVAEIRGLPAAADIKAGVIPRSEVRELLSRSLSSADRENFRQLTRLYRLVGFLGANDDYEELYLDFAAEAVIGFYQPSKDTLWIVGEGDTIDFQSFDATQRSTIAHEFVHAIQDRALRTFGEEASRRTEGDLDGALALSAVIEGDAVYHERLWALAHIAGSSVGRTPGQSVAGGSIPAAIERELRFPYESGLDWVSLTGAANGNEWTDRILRGERITTAEILHPGAFPNGWEPKAVSNWDIGGDLGAGWKSEGGGSFGEFRLRNFFQLSLDGLRSVDAAQGWAGDRYDLYGNGDDAVAVLRVEFASAQEAAELVPAMQAWLNASGASTGANAGTVAVFENGRALVLRPAGETGWLFVFASNRELAGRAASLLDGP